MCSKNVRTKESKILKYCSILLFKIFDKAKAQSRVEQKLPCNLNYANFNCINSPSLTDISTTSERVCNTIK